MSLQLTNRRRRPLCTEHFWPMLSPWFTPSNLRMQVVQPVQLNDKTPIHERKKKSVKNLEELAPELNGCPLHTLRLEIDYKGQTQTTSAPSLSPLRSYLGYMRSNKDFTRGPAMSTSEIKRPIQSKKEKNSGGKRLWLAPESNGRILHSTSSQVQIQHIADADQLCSEAFLNFVVPWLYAIEQGLYTAFTHQDHGSNSKVSAGLDRERHWTYVRTNPNGLHPTDEIPSK
ncbi:hypothetical protein B0H16DRAFT_1845553 [Mycena metata]|uniref:Uncharacterized protein n=1 Tax=Mycena metata TaxID=1033252 RepID=A0AAD7IV95_9AGAR|nr:hypothetical protein B0H16DRAFT_1845553 [Mycena metata]